MSILQLPITLHTCSLFQTIFICLCIWPRWASCAQALSLPRGEWELLSSCAVTASLRQLLPLWPGLWNMGSGTCGAGLNCAGACGVFLSREGLSLCLLSLLHWQTDCLSLSHQGSPKLTILFRLCYFLAGYLKTVLGPKTLLDIFALGLQVFLRAWSFKLAAVRVSGGLHSCVYLSGQIWIKCLRAKLAQTACMQAWAVSGATSQDGVSCSWRSSVRSGCTFQAQPWAKFAVAYAVLSCCL